MLATHSQIEMKKGHIKTVCQFFFIKQFRLLGRFVLRPQTFFSERGLFFSERGLLFAPSVDFYFLRVWTFIFPHRGLLFSPSVDCYFLQAWTFIFSKCGLLFPQSVDFYFLRPWTFIFSKRGLLFSQSVDFYFLRPRTFIFSEHGLLFSQNVDFYCLRVWTFIFSQRGLFFSQSMGFYLSHWSPYNYFNHTNHPVRMKIRRRTFFGKKSAHAIGRFRKKRKKKILGVQKNLRQKFFERSLIFFNRAKIEIRACQILTESVQLF